jgi:beta-glucanase (GH16 family)
MKCVLAIAVSATILFSCSANKKLSQNAKTFVDAATPKTAIPFMNDSAKTVQNTKEWILDFSDEFNDATIDKTKWTIENSTKKRVDITLFSNDKQVEEKDGHMFIYYSKAAEVNDSAYYAGRFISKDKYAPTYGFLEARMHLVKPNGYQTAFWMMPASGDAMRNSNKHDGTANDGAEIDIVEGNRLKRYSLGLHWDGYAKPYHKGAGANIRMPNMHDTEYHIFGLEWTPTYLKYYYDGKIVKEINDPKAIPMVAHYIYFSGSCWGTSDWVDGDIRKNEFIQNGGVEKGYIDYVRVFKSKPL